MMVEQILFLKALSKVQGEELYKRIYFVSDKIKSFTILENDSGEAYGIDMKLQEGADITQIERKLNHVIESEIRTQKILETQTIWSSSNSVNYQENAYDKLVQKGYVFEMGEGLIGFAEPFQKLMDRLDRIIKDIVISDMNGTEYIYPTMISTKIMEDTGYFNSFPHMLMFTTHLQNDLDVYNKFYDYYQENGKIDSELLSLCNNTDYCLPPTMCYHTYHQMRNSKWEEHESRVITSKGKSFRFEGKYHHQLERLWDFTIREIIFLGSQKFVFESREKFMKASFALMEKLGLTGHCEVANDPFFCNNDTSAKIFNQKIMKLKYELQLHIEQNKTIAAASFNYHEQFFGQRFHIEQNDSWIYTGCVGFGLERLAYVFVCHYGVDEDDWKYVLDKF